MQRRADWNKAHSGVSCVSADRKFESEVKSQGEGVSGGVMVDTVADTRRLYAKPQNLNDAYGPPSNFLEIDVSNPETIGVGRGRFTTYEIRLKVRLLAC